MCKMDLPILKVCINNFLDTSESSDLLTSLLFYFLHCQWRQVGGAGGAPARPAKIASRARQGQYRTCISS